jgi:hypothetical protein
MANKPPPIKCNRCGGPYSSYGHTCEAAQEQAPSPLDAAACSVIRVRYRVDVQSVSGRWDNVEIRDDEAIARRDEAEWRSWLNENRKTWKDIRIVKETTTAEVL